MEGSLNQTVNDSISTAVEKIKQAPHNLMPILLELEKPESPVTYETTKYDQYTTATSQAVIVKAVSKNRLDGSLLEEGAWYTPSLVKNTLIIASTSGDVYYREASGAEISQVKKQADPQTPRRPYLYFK